MYEYSEHDVFEGWQPKVKETLDKIKALGAHIDQVKEKFGGLRIYYHSEANHLEIDKLITEAEHWCERHCEFCGAAGARLEIRGWWKTCCTDCQKKRLESIS